MKHPIIFIVLLLLSLNSNAQQSTIAINGNVKNFDGLLQNATVSLYAKGQTDTLKTLTNENGSFRFSSVKYTKFFILVSYIGYKTFLNDYSISIAKGDKTLDDIFLQPSSDMLSNVTLESQKVQIKEDTVSYKIDSTMYRKNDNVEALLKNLPGVQVDKDGTVTAQGKQVTKVKVNGKDFFSGDVTTATREINADMVDRIQVIDDYGDQAAFTGIKDGDPSKTLNIQLKKDKNKGYFGNATAGAGTENRHLESISFNKFNNEQQLSVLGNINNTNASLFNFGSSGGGSMGNMMGGMARSMGIGRGGGGVGSVIGNSGNNDGINTNKSIGLNYRDQWGSRMSVYGSYSFSDRNSNTLKTSTQQNLFANSSSSYIQESNNNNISDNHRFSFNIEYKIDSMNFLKFSPSVTYNKTNTQYISDFNSIANNVLKISEGSLGDTLFSKSPNLNGSLLFNHRFSKRGRTLSLTVNAGKSSTQTDEDYENLTTYYLPNATTFDDKFAQNILQDNNNENYGVKASYTEPLSKKRNLEFNYAYNYQLVGNDRKTYNIDPVSGTSTYVDSSSNIYDNIYKTNRLGINFRTTEKKYNYTVGLSVQPATIQTNSISSNSIFSNSMINYYPIIRFAYNFSRSRSLNINYNGNSNQPSNSQLQPIVDNTNTPYITIGNPNLKPEFTNTFSLRYNNFDFISGNVFFGNISASFTQDKIVNSTRLLPKGIQETSYLNSNGYYTVLAFYNISKPIKNRKYVFNIGGNISYNNNVSFLIDSLNVSNKNTGKNWVIGERFSTDIKIKKWLETTFSANYSLNNSKYSLQTDLNSNTVGWTLSNNARFFLPKDFIISYDIDKTINTGYSTNVNTNPLIISTTIEKQLFKKKNGSIKLQGLDLLNENIGISRTVSSTGYTDARTNRLGRYFLMTFVYRLNKFKSDQQGTQQMGFPGGGDMKMMRGGPGF